MMIAGLLFTHGLLIDNVALASVALLGYMFGRRTRRKAEAPTDVNLLIEFARAQCVASDLQHLAQRIRTDADSQLAAISAFQKQVAKMQTDATVADWRHLRQSADQLISPTLGLASSLSLACDDIRDQQSQLMTFADARVDRETGLLNRRAMVDHLHARLTTRGQGNRKLCLVICSVDVDPFDSAAGSSNDLQDVARLFEDYARENDVVARFGPQEFVVILSRMTLEGAIPFGERLLKVIDASLERRAWIGVVEAEPEESHEELLARAESALRAAAQEEVSTLFVHDGTAPRVHPFEVRGAHQQSTKTPVEAQQESLAPALDKR